MYLLWYLFWTILDWHDGRRVTFVLVCVCVWSCLQVDYNKPSGYDRARNREIGKKDITLETMEEAFTSEHWIVRIFKVRVGVPITDVPTVGVPTTTTIVHEKQLVIGRQPVGPPRDAHVCDTLFDAVIGMIYPLCKILP